MLKRNSINAEKRGTRAWAENGDDFKKGEGPKFVGILVSYGQCAQFILRTRVI